MHFSIVERPSVGRHKWDELVNASGEGWLWHLYDFQEVIQNDGWEDLSFAIADKLDRILCIFPLQVRKASFFVRIAKFKAVGGPVFLPQIKEDEAGTILEYIKKHITLLAKSYNAYEIFLALPSLAPRQRQSNPVPENNLLLLGCIDNKSQTYIIDLKNTEEQIWNGLETRCRTAIRKAQKNGYEFKNAESEEDIKIYYNLHLETYRRTGARPHTFEFFKLIWDYFVKNGLANFYFVTKNKRYVAGQLIAAFKNGAVYVSGASDINHIKFGVNNLLLWNSILSAKKNGCDCFEVGEAFPHLASGKMKGINDFKRSFGGKLYPYYKGEIVFKPLLKFLIESLYARKIIQVIRRNLK